MKKRARGFYCAHLKSRMTLAPCERPPHGAGIAAAMMRAVGAEQPAMPLICIEARGPRGDEDVARIPEPWAPRSVLGRLAGADLTPATVL